MPTPSSATSARHNRLVESVERAEREHLNAASRYTAAARTGRLEDGTEIDPLVAATIGQVEATLAAALVAELAAAAVCTALEHLATATRSAARLA